MSGLCHYSLANRASGRSGDVVAIGHACGCSRQPQAVRPLTQLQPAWTASVVLAGDVRVYVMLSTVVSGQANTLPTSFSVTTLMWSTAGLPSARSPTLAQFVIL